jgi:hypothetical protein
MKRKIYQIQIALRGIRPKIWLRILIPPDLRLSDFHEIIQITMGWTNSHMHQFIKNGTYFTESIAGDDIWDELGSVDYKKMKISDLLTMEKEKVVYEYDFGDGWEHNIILEKILPVDPKIKYPVCLKGKMKCPPEDCGGVWGYSDMLEVLKQPDHIEYEEFIEWLGDGFDPEDFDINEVNRRLLTRRI